MAANFKNRAMMSPGTTVLAVLLMGLSCHAQPDDTLWSLVTEWDCLEKAEDVEDIEDLDKECAAVIENLMEEQESLDQEANERARKFSLYNGCLPMGLVVEDLSTDAKEIGLSKEAIQNALESRLRAAHLYKTLENFPETARRARLLFPGKGFGTNLYVRVSVVSPAFSIVLQYNKLVTDEPSGVKAYAITWDKGATGTATDAGYIMSALAGYMDEFLVEFLRVNEPDC